MKFTLLPFAAACVLSSSIAMAETNKEEAPVKAPTPEQKVIKTEESKASSIFQQLDQNQDGKVSPQEAQVSPALVKGFKQIDSNKDGFLTIDEFAQLQVKATAKRAYTMLAALHAL